MNIKSDKQLLEFFAGQALIALHESILFYNDEVLTKATLIKHAKKAWMVAEAMLATHPCKSENSND